MGVRYEQVVIIVFVHGFERVLPSRSCCPLYRFEYLAVFHFKFQFVFYIELVKECFGEAYPP